MPKTTPKLVDDVRRCAARKMSATQIACELSKPAHPLTRNAVAGIAWRNKIELHGVGRRKRSVRARNPRHTPRKPKPVVVQQVHVYHDTALIIQPTNSRCWWNGCMHNAEDGGIFCFGHGRKGLLE